MDANLGTIKQIMGPVVDVEFPSGKLPAMYNALKVTNHAINTEQENLVVEVSQHLGQNTVRCISMDTTEGLKRGDVARDTGAPISMPVGPHTLGRILNVVGDPIDELGEIPEGTPRLPIHRAPPSYVEQATSAEMFETGIKVIDLLAPYARGGKI
ncbi:MAG: F0F1 ATP synthase subunit beta, partial [Alphaproteobacteria bacterium]|nr:F0F1 ATP synthase subunit beta [Alphaproteobacteria bacterium]